MNQPKIPRSAIIKVCEAVLCEVPARQATVYLTPKFTLKATRQFKPRRGNSRTTILLSAGTPNYHEARFIKACVKAGEPFPVKKVQIKPYIQ